MRDIDIPTEHPRIVHVAQTFTGGIASYFEELAEYQIARFGRHSVAFVVPAGAKRFARLDDEQLFCFRSASRSPSALIDFARVARAAIGRLKPNIVHLHSSFAGAVVRGMLAHRDQRPRVIYCPHGWAFGMEASPVRKMSYAFVERRLASLTDLILVNSQSEYDLATRFGVPAVKLRLITNGIAWASRPETAARDGPLRVAFIGRHDRQKGLDVLLDTIRRFSLSNIHFEIVGDCVIERRSRRTDASAQNVTFHGWLSRRDTFELLQRVDAVVMPSRWEAFGLVAIEAMRAGVPVIASNRGALPEIVQHGSTGLIFDFGAQDSLGRVLTGLNREQLRRLGIAAREQWERYYLSDRMNDSISDAYLHVLHRGEQSRDGAAAGSAPAPLFGASTR